MGINLRNFNIKPLKQQVSRSNLNDKEAFINSMENKNVYETANYENKENE